MSSKKMFIVPPDVMAGLQRKQRLEEIDQPERKVRGDLDAQMNDLLHSEDIPDREKLALYNQLLQHLLQKKKNKWKFEHRDGHTITTNTSTTVTAINTTSCHYE